MSKKNNAENAGCVAARHFKRDTVDEWGVINYDLEKQQETTTILLLAPSFRMCSWEQGARVQVTGVVYVSLVLLLW